MTNNFKSYSLPEAVPDAIVVKKGELGGYILEAFYGEQRRVAGFANTNTLATVITAMLVGPQTLETVAQAQAALDRARAVQAEPAAVVEAKVEKIVKPKAAPKAKKVEAAPEQPAKKRGRPKLSDEEKARRAAERKAMNGAAEQKLAA